MIGTQIGAYRVLEQIGAGGMGAVWLAEHTMLGRRAAIKVLHPSFSTRPEIVTRFFNEARAATAIADPGIVQIFDFGHHTDGSAYIVMELLDGETLDKRIRTRGTLTLGDALLIMRQVATSLGAAHARGIVHRDLKPENIFLVRDNEVVGGERAKILDFGIAKLTGDQSIKTQTSAMMGTPMFMSPEQCRGAGTVDQRSDVYALGCVLFTALTGRPPFDAEGVGDIIAMHLREPAPPPSAYASGIPPEIDQLVLRCLQKDPAHRFASALELARVLDMARTSTSSMSAVVPAARSGVGARPLAVTTLSTAAGSRDLASAQSLPPAPSSKRWLAGVALVPIVAIAAVAVVTSRKSDRPTQPSVQPDVASTPAPQPAAVMAPAVAPAPEYPAEPPSPDAVLAGRMRDILKAFTVWAPSHVGDACPDVYALGVTALDPWSHALVITCVDQPSNQIIGVRSNGPDGIADNADDIASWERAELTSLVRGARWQAVAEKPMKPVVKPDPKKSEPKKPAPSTTSTPQPTKPAKPASTILYDASGLPIERL